MKSKDFEMFSLKLWDIWKDRCKWTHRTNLTINGVHKIKWGEWTESFLHEYRNTQLKINLSCLSLISRYSAHVENRAFNEYTFFVDATFNDDTLSYATGYAIFDPGGSLCAVGFRKIPPTGSVMAAEVKAIYNGALMGSLTSMGPRESYPTPLKIFMSSPARRCINESRKWPSVLPRALLKTPPFLGSGTASARLMHWPTS